MADLHSNLMGLSYTDWIGASVFSRQQAKLLFKLRMACAPGVSNSTSWRERPRVSDRTSRPEVADFAFQEFNSQAIPHEIAGKSDDQ
jgi:hypothetical protein